MTAPCGTYPAYRRHYRLGEEIDPACRQAERKYRNELRQKKPEYDRRRLRVRNRAIRRLIELHRTDFVLLEEDEWQKEGA